MNDVKVWSTPAISNDKILPTTLPPDVPTVEMTARACRGEYVPLSFCVRSSVPLVGLNVERCDGLDCCLDIRYVKCWWQGGDKSVVQKHPTFTPELLLKDPGLVTVDMEAKRNVIRRPVQDATELQPIYLEAGCTQQYWVTVKVPNDARAGIWNMELRISSRGNTLRTIPIKIDVLPFDLEDSPVEQAMFYTGRLLAPGQPVQTESNWKTREQYRDDMINMLAHGITTPICYQTDDGQLEEVIRIRQEVGMKTDPLYLCGGRENRAYTDSNDHPECKDLKINVLKKRLFFNRLGINELFFYGVDEAAGPDLIKQRRGWEAIHETGGKVFVASYKTDSLELVGDLLDVAIIQDKCVEQIPQWHAHGKKVWLYGNPQVVAEYPETYRRNYGLQLLADGWNGSVPFAYQHTQGLTIWDDFDHRIRDHAFTYPTIDRPINTRQWEGFLAGIYDIRYAATLLKLGGMVPPIDGRDLDEVRSEMIDNILIIK